MPRVIQHPAPPPFKQTVPDPPLFAPDPPSLETMPVNVLLEYSRATRPPPPLALTLPLPLILVPTTIHMDPPAPPPPAYAPSVLPFDPAAVTDPSKTAF